MGGQLRDVEAARLSEVEDFPYSYRILALMMRFLFLATVPTAKGFEYARGVRENRM